MIPVQKKMLTFPAHFYDGAKQLPGTLELREKELHFIFDDFKHSHLNLCIPLSEIEYVRVFLLFGIADHGLKVASQCDKIDIFILDDSRTFCEAVKKQIQKPQ